MPVSGILAALYYLSQEAERADRHDIKAVLRSAIVAIDGLAGGGSSDGIADPGTCALLQFYDSFAKASPAVRVRFLNAMDAT